MWRRNNHLDVITFRRVVMASQPYDPHPRILNAQQNSARTMVRWRRDVLRQIGLYLPLETFLDSGNHITFIGQEERQGEAALLKGL